MAKYLVQNSRSQRVVSLYGQVLASAASSSRGTPGTLWLTEDQYSSPRVQRLIGLKRLRLVKTEEETSSVSPAPQPVKVVAAPEPAPEPEPVVVAPEPEPEPEESSSVAVVQADGDIVPAEDADEEGEHQYDEAELTALTLPYIRPIAKKFGIDIANMRKAEIIAAIIDTQGS